jgi:hypothetical protein
VLSKRSGSRCGGGASAVTLLTTDEGV